MCVLPSLCCAANTKFYFSSVFFRHFKVKAGPMLPYKYVVPTRTEPCASPLAPRSLGHYQTAQINLSMPPHMCNVAQIKVRHLKHSLSQATFELTSTSHPISAPSHNTSLWQHAIWVFCVSLNALCGDYGFTVIKQTNIFPKRGQRSHRGPIKVAPCYGTP